MKYKYYSFIILALLVHVHVAWAQTREIDSLKTLLPELKDSASVNMLNHIGYKLAYLNPEEGHKYLQESIRQATAIDFLKGLAYAQLLSGYFFELRSKYDESIAAYKECSKTLDRMDSTKLSNRGMRVDMLSGLGFTHYRKGNYAEALHYLFKALPKAEQIPDPSHLAAINIHIGLVYYDQHDLDRALEYSQKAIDLAVQSKNHFTEARAVNNAGLVFEARKQYKEAAQYYERSLEIGRKIHDLRGVGATLSNLGNISKQMGKHDLALKYLNEADAIRRQAGDDLEVAINNAAKAEIYILKGQFRVAEKLLDESCTIAEKIEAPETLLLIYGRYVSLYREEKKYEQAFAWMERRNLLNDSLFNEKKARQLSELEVRFETERKEQAILLLERNNKIKTYWNAMAIGGLGIILLTAIAVIIVLRYREKKGREMLNLRIDFLLAENQQLTRKYQYASIADAKPTFESQDQRLLNKVVEVIKKNMSNPLFGVEKLAEEMCMSRDSLHRRMKRETGFPPSEFIRSMRLKHAANMLRSQSCSVAQIGFMVGFNDQSYFSKSFKKQFGILPSDFSKSMTN